MTKKERLAKYQQEYKQKTALHKNLEKRLKICNRVYDKLDRQADDCWERLDFLMDRILDLKDEIKGDR